MNKKLLAFLLHFAQYASLTSAITSALTAILPLLIGKANWQEVLYAFAFTLIFTALTSLISHTKDENLRQALLDDLSAVKPLVAPSTWRATTVANMPAVNDQTSPTK